MPIANLSFLLIAVAVLGGADYFITKKWGLFGLILPVLAIVAALVVNLLFLWLAVALVLLFVLVYQENKKTPVFAKREEAPEEPLSEEVVLEGETPEQAVSVEDVPLDEPLPPED